MNVERVQLAPGRAVDVVRLGSRGGRPVLYFHSPASSGEELVGVADEAARALSVELLAIVRSSVTDHDPAESFASTVAVYAAGLVDALGLAPVSVLGWSGGAPYALAAAIRLGPLVVPGHERDRHGRGDVGASRPSCATATNPRRPVPPSWPRSPSRGPRSGPGSASCSALRNDRSLILCRLLV